MVSPTATTPGSPSPTAFKRSHCRSVLRCCKNELLNVVLVFCTQKNPELFEINSLYKPGVGFLCLHDAFGMDSFATTRLRVP